MANDWPLFSATGRGFGFNVPMAGRSGYGSQWRGRTSYSRPYYSSFKRPYNAKGGKGKVGMMPIVSTGREFRTPPCPQVAITEEPEGFLHQGEGSVALVATACTPSSGDLNSTWHSKATRIASVPFSTSSRKVTFRHSGSRKSSIRLCISGSHQRGNRFQFHQTPDSLVCDNQKGRRKRKSKTYIGLSRNKYLFFPKEIQTGPHESHLSCVEKKECGGQK